MGGMRPVLSQVSLVVEDMDATIAFYRLLGVNIDDERNWRSHHVDVEMPNGLHLEFDSVALTKGYDAGWQRRPGGGSSVLVFAFPSRGDIDRVYEDVTGAGHRGHQAPFDAFWGARYAVVEDPDGNRIGLMSPIDPERGGPPPDL